MLSVKRLGLIFLVLSGAWFSSPRCCAQGEPVVEVNGSGGGGKPAPLWRVPVHISVSTIAGYDENVNTLSSGGDGSAFAGVNLLTDYSFGTSRTKATLHTGTGFTYYSDLSDNRYDPNVYLTLSVAHQANLRLAVNGTLTMSYQAEPDFQNDLGLNRRAGNYFSAQGNIEASYQWLPRISTVTSYGLGTVWYDQNLIADQQNHFDHQFGQSFRFLFLPVTTLVADFRLSLVTYDTADRGSRSYALLGGVDHTFLPGLQGTFRGGVQLRDADQIAADDHSTVDPYFEASLTYLIGGKTSLNWSASYATEESNIATSPGSLSFRTGLQLSYAITPRITSVVAFSYAKTDNEASSTFITGNPPVIIFGNPEISEDAFSLSLALSYAFNSRFSANVGYDRSEVDSEAFGRSYSRNRYSGGLTLNF